jgi:hypothetical protein
MTLEQIKAAVEAGQTVHWANSGYTVVKDRIGQWLIVWDLGGRSEHCIGLTWLDGITMNGAPEEFFIAKKGKAK